jgi:two-component system cell cycle sensor histidine kinase/response regulator CckA
MDDPDSGLPSMLSSGMDVTELRSLERAVRIKEKLAAIGTMAGGIAHDFNNVLTAIYGYSVLSLDSIPERDPVSQYLKRIVSASERARSLVDRLLTFAHNEESDLRPCNIAPTIVEACDLLRGSLPSTIGVAVDVDQGLPAILADSTQIHQVIMNLGTNAGKAMANTTGVLSIKAESVFLKRPDLMHKSTLRAGPHVVITVTDNGVGMAVETIEHIYNPFYSSNELGFGKGKRGTGLGLSVVHSIVYGHNGYIDVSSTRNVGTTFRVYLPCCDMEEVVAAPDGHVTDGSSSHVLFVDDEEMVGDASKRMLEKLGNSVTFLTDPFEALEVLEQDANSVDVLITDETMPGMTGSQLVGKVREFNRELPIIIVSGNLKPFRETESTYFLRKPYTMSELDTMVSQARNHELQVADVD